MKRFFVAGLAGAALALTLSTGDIFAAPAAAVQPPAAYAVGPLHGGGQRGRPHGGAMQLVSATASVTGLTAEQVRTELTAGKSLAQIAQANGKTADQVIAAARASYQTALSQAVTNGRLTQAQADAALARFDQSAPQVMNDTTLGQRRGPGKPGKVAPREQTN
ncbi:MAG TPA: hypothetical protein VFU22_15940 [Roseiflexaceae bacterium]|nr:hypothetical protein [Roseiflexaceae bacterium]